MDRRQAQARNHPQKGSSIAVEPIRNLHDIERIKTLLRPSPRNYCLFVLGINTAYRANELLSLPIKRVASLRYGDTLAIKQSKNKKYRRIALNRAAIFALEYWLDHHPNRFDDAPLFPSKRAGQALTVGGLWKLINQWCVDIGMTENVGTHTLRKTWGYHQLRSSKSDENIMPMLMEAYGHSSQSATLRYLGIQTQEVENLYLRQEL